MNRGDAKRRARQALEARRTDLLRRQSTSADEGRSARSKRVCDPMERASLADEGERLLHLGADEARRLSEVEAALDRIASGDWGTCEVCGDPIAARRLELLPEARRCVTCAAEPD